MHGPLGPARGSARGCAPNCGLNGSATHDPAACHAQSPGSPRPSPASGPAGRLHSAAAPTVPLYRALQVGDLDQVKRHIYHGSDINSPDAQGEYPLHVAARNGQIAIARALVDHRARLDIRDSEGPHPAAPGLGWGRTALAEVLFVAGAADSPQALLFALVREGSADRDALALLRKRGADLNAVAAPAGPPCTWLW